MFSVTCLPRSRFIELGSGGFAQLLEQRVNRGTKLRKISRFCLPNDGMVYLAYSVDKYIAETNGVSGVREPRPKLPIHLAELSQRLADDLELPLYCGAEHLVTQVGVEGVPGKKPGPCVRAVARKEI
jgi:hypothetical protein